MNKTLLENIMSDKVIVFNGKPLKVIKNVDYEGARYKLLGKSVRYGRDCFFIYRQGRFLTVSASSVNATVASTPKVQKASKNMPTVLSLGEHERIINAFISTLSTDLIPFEFRVEMAKGVNKGCAYTLTNVIQLPKLLSNDVASHKGFLEYNSVVWTWKKLGYTIVKYGKNKAVQKEYRNNSEMMAFGMWAFLVHELAHLLHKHNIKHNGEYCKQSHEFGFCRALTQILEGISYEDYLLNLGELK